MSVNHEWAHWQADLFDPYKVPFSCRNSFLAISWLDGDAAGFWLRSLRGGDEHTDDGRLFLLQCCGSDGQPCKVKVTLYPDRLLFRRGQDWLALAFADGDTVALAGQGLGLMLSMQPKSYDYAQRLAAAVHISHARQDLSLRVQQTHGQSVLDAPWQGQRATHICLTLQPDVADGTLAASLHLFRVLPLRQTPASYASAQAVQAADFADWLDASLPLPAELASGRLLAAYITWSCYVPAEGCLSLPAMYMSKNWMTNIWSWDHCFNALALAKGQPQRAWEQMCVIFANQHESGRLPDFINDRYAYWRFTKPPVHGWAFSRLRELAPDFYTAPRREQIREWLALQAGSWLDGCIDGLPCYDHGNDAGWDNSTVFLEGTPLHSPDLATFLILQLQELSDLARLDGLHHASQQWLGQAEVLQHQLLSRLWDGQRFVARHAMSGKVVDGGDSLIAFTPLLLGNRLPLPIRQHLLAQLFITGRFATEHGLATEGLTSPYYQADGYWRGPIWAPTMALMVDALHCCGAGDEAWQLAEGFTRMANRSGMAENFDARSGKGLRDPAFTWTSSVFLLLGNGLLKL